MPIPADTGAEAVDVPVTDVDSAATRLSALFADETNDTPVDEEEEEEGSEQSEDDLDLTEDDESGEPETVITDAPVSLNAEEKARYAQLPKEAQQFVAELETRRNADVQQVTTKAKEAQRAADARAAQADAQAKAEYATQLKQFADALAPQRPDPALAASDPMQFIAQNAQYEAAKAQHDQFVQQVQAVESEAQDGIKQTFIAERDRRLMAIPEVQNEQTRDAFFGKVFEVAEALGFDRSNVASKATAEEITMLKQLGEWKEKASKYDTAMSRQMQRVRQGKPKTIRPGTAQAQASVSTAGLDKSRARLRETGDVRDAAAVIDQLYSKL